MSLIARTEREAKAVLDAEVWPTGPLTPREKHFIRLLGEMREDRDRWRDNAQGAVDLIVKLTDAARGTSSAGGVYCKLCDGPATATWEDVTHSCPLGGQAHGERLALSDRGEGFVVSLIERWTMGECPDCGVLTCATAEQVQWCDEHCRSDKTVIEVVRADAHRGAVEDLRWVADGLADLNHGRRRNIGVTRNCEVRLREVIARLGGQ